MRRRCRPSKAAKWCYGSASVATIGQVAAWLEADRPALRIDPMALAAGKPVVEQALAFARDSDETVLIYATSTPAEVKAVQQQLGVERAGTLVENALGEIAAGLRQSGVRRFVIAGGETSGAVVKALGATCCRSARRSTRAYRPPQQLRRAVGAGPEVRQLR